ncbi:hypothetical protein FJT64_002191 [Amphibalanus amphitrite]|uniref:Uncharacterized protein n=1 Tax=Amphibalanus amphitrite TaxID=1232801 RepID=A0A6A4WPW7_AMPAM|nr:hypothetical protein FJT64_002191 [Amphibalanus amphitrite]
MTDEFRLYEVRVLLVAVLAVGLGATLARSAPVAAATPRLPSAESAEQGQFGQRLSSAVDKEDSRGPLPEEADGGEQAAASSEEPPRPPPTTPTDPPATARPGVPAVVRSAHHRRRGGRRRTIKIAPTVSTQTLIGASEPSDGSGSTKTSQPPATRTAPEPEETAAGAARAGRSAVSPADPEPVPEQRQRLSEDEQETSGSSRVLTYHVQHTEHARVAKSPRESPDFFVPPIQRRPEPYKHPFIPSPPTTTSEPYVHPFIPSSPTTTSEPYVHPHIPVPPESTRQPPAPAEERPQARRVSSGSSVPRLHLPRKPVPTAVPPPVEITTEPPTAAPASDPAATIVHQQKVEAGLIVGEYGELSLAGDTVRGVKYSADSSVDRSLLEKALRQFLQL